MLSRFSKDSIGTIGLVIFSLSMAHISGGIINECWAPIQYTDDILPVQVNPIVEIRRSYDLLNSPTGFPMLVRWHLYIESEPWPPGDSRKPIAARKLHYGGHFMTGPWHYNDVLMTTIASQITSLTVVHSIVYTGADQRKHQSSASLAFVWGIHRGAVNSPHKWPVTQKMFPFDDVIMPWWDQTIPRDRLFYHTIMCSAAFQYFFYLIQPLFSACSTVQPLKFVNG